MEIYRELSLAVSLTTVPFSIGQTSFLSEKSVWSSLSLFVYFLGERERAALARAVDFLQVPLPPLTNREGVSPGPQPYIHTYVHTHILK